MGDVQNSSPSLKQKLKSWSCWLPQIHDQHHLEQGEPLKYANAIKPRHVRSSSNFMINPNNNNAAKQHSTMPRPGRHGRRHSADFRYDALSYSLNFDQGDLHTTHFDQFNSRLPPSPPPNTSSSGIAACT